MQELLDLGKTLLNLIKMAVDGIGYLVRSLSEIPNVFAQFQYFIPSVVYEYIMIGITLTVVLVILGRANK